MSELLIAAQNDYLFIIESLIQNGTKIDKKDASGMTELHYILQ